MHGLLVRVLQHRQLNSAAQLFTISDYDVIADLHTVFSNIKAIFDNPNYEANKSEQSIVEIVLARIVSAIRETNSIETYSADLVDVLDNALKHRLTTLDQRGNYVDSAHCKISIEILSCLFMHYNKKPVMTVAVPVAVKALSCGNNELMKNVTSYISLSAIHNSKVLAQFAIQIISSIVNGNHSLLRVLPQIYSDNREPFHAHLSQLMRILDESSENWEEKRALLQFASSVASFKPDFLIPYLPRLPVYLLSPATSSQVLHIYLTLCAQGKALLLAEYLTSIAEAAGQSVLQGNIATIANVISLVGRVSGSLALSSLDILSKLAETADVNTSLPVILNEIEGVAQVWPRSVNPIVSNLNVLSTKAPHLQRIIERITNLACSETSFRDSVTVISIGNENSNESLLLKKSARLNESETAFSVPRPSFVIVTDCSADASALELDKNTENLALAYQNRSLSSLSKHKSRSFVSIMPGQSRSNSENVMTGSKDLSTSSIAGPSARAPSAHSSRATPLYLSPKTQTLPASFAPTQVQMCRDGRVRPVARRTWVNAYETTFPAHSGPITTTKLQEEAISEEPAEVWPSETVDRTDVVRQFVDHRRSKIRKYVEEVTALSPVPIQCTVEGSKGSKHCMRVHFACQIRSANCIFHSGNLFAFKTKHAATWLHLMFLQLEASSLSSSDSVVCQSSPAFQTLSHCWTCLPSCITKAKPFVTLVTSAFPAAKDHEKLLKELQESNYMDFFQYDHVNNKWACFSCSFPDKVRSFVEEKVLCGQLKEKRGRWKFLKRWNTKYFTLSSASLSVMHSREKTTTKSGLCSSPSIDLRSIRAVKSLSRGRRSRKSLRKAFEIFTADNSSYILKATDEKKAEEWMHCLQFAVAQVKRDATL